MNSDGQVTALNRVAFEKHREQSIHACVRAATLQARFWQQLSRDVPNIGRVHSLAAEISKATKDAQAHFQALFKINDQSTAAMRTYASFLFVRGIPLCCPYSRPYTMNTVSSDLAPVPLPWSYPVLPHRKSPTTLQRHKL